MSKNKEVSKPILYGTKGLVLLFVMQKIKNEVKL